MMKKSPSKPSLSTPTKSKKSASKDREKKKMNLLGEPSSSSCNAEKLLITYEDDKKYFGFGPETIQCIAEQFTNELISEDICTTLAEDITYKMRELLQAACINMRHGKRKYLKVDDVNAVFKNFNIERIYGPASPSWITFGDANNYSCIPDKSVNLIEVSTAEMTVSEPGDIGLDYKWLKDTSLFNQLLVNNSLNSYSQKIMNAAVSSKKPLRMMALKDVTKNINIGPIILHLCNFCFLILQKNVTYSNLATPVLQLLEAIMFNPCTSYSVEEKQMTLLIYLLLENIMNATSVILDDVIPICRTLGRLCVQWPSGVQIVVDKVNKYLLPDEPVKRLSAPVICALTYIGNDALNQLLWPHLAAMFKCMKCTEPTECLKLYCSILSAASIMYKKAEWDCVADRALYMEFGDSLVPIWRLNYEHVKQDTNVSSESAQPNWFNIKRALLKTLKVHSQQQVSSRIAQFKHVFRKARPPILNKQISISGFKCLPARRRTHFVCDATVFDDVTRTQEIVNIVTGRRTLFTLKRTFTISNTRCNSSHNVRDMLYMM